MFDIIVVNARFEPTRGEYVGRPSPLGNPFALEHPADDLRRDEICDRFEDFLEERVALRDERLCAALDRLYAIGVTRGVLELRCWCAPKRCHASSIARILETWEPGWWR
jgi:hypothetical protein